MDKLAWKMAGSLLKRPSRSLSMRPGRACWISTTWLKTVSRLVGVPELLPSRMKEKDPLTLLGHS
jgi:hypothetical protein